MAQSDSNRITDAGRTNASRPFPMDSDSAFHATPIVTSAIEGALPKNDSTFMQNQVAIQRSPNAVKDEASKLSRKLSVKSNGSHDTAQPVYGGNLPSIPQGEQMDDRGGVRSEAVSTIVDAANDCSLSKSDSERSAKSARSVRSQIAVGAYPVGTLRLHSPSPTRDHFQRESFEVLKSGDIFIVRDISVGAIFGYDTKSFEIKEAGQFEGVKNLPSGAHFFWSGSSTGSLRTGFWIMSDKTPTSGYGDIFVKRWDKYNETLEE
jgi:A1 cistron-splicing factor AAR2